MYPFQHKQYETHTAADGSFDITVDRGTYWLSIGAPGPRGATQRGWYVPGGLTANLGDGRGIRPGREA